VLSRLPLAGGAAFDSRRLEHEPTCLEETRIELLAHITHWYEDPQAPCIFWLNGMAGTGKSTIARTVARKWAKEKRLGASFFFSRGQGDLAHASKFFTTLAYQLAKAQPGLAAGVRQAICNSPDISQKSLCEQWEHLILEPLSQLNDASLILVIDALDECDGEEDIELILQLLSQEKAPRAVRLHIFVTSRPETPIRHGFEDISGAIHRDFVLHEISDSIVNRDISVLLRHEFERIRKRRRLPKGWPDESSRDHLVRKAGGLFIYAATVCRFIGHKDSYPPERLTFVLEDKMDHGSPTEQLDFMYTKLLQYALVEGREPQGKERLLQRFRRIVGSIVISVDVLTVGALAEILVTTQWEVEETLESLSSVLDYSESMNIRLLHPSFRDFLLDTRRCQDPDFRIVGDNAHGEFVVSCLELMSKHLKQDVCSLRLPGRLTSEVDRHVVQCALPQEIQYACRYWVDHLQRSRVKLCDHDSLHDRVHAFLKEHFLHWLEALSLMGNMSDGVLMVKALYVLLTVCDPDRFACYLYPEIRRLQNLLDSKEPVKSSGWPRLYGSFLI
jgi:hypothetical protein